MKFFKPIPKSNSPSQNWVYLDDVQDILEPFRQICFLYSTHHNQLPKNGDPNTASSIAETHSEESEMSFLSISQHSHYYIFELSIRVSFVEHLPSKYDSDILSPILYELLTNLHYGLFVYNLPYCKSIYFIETKLRSEDSFHRYYLIKALAANNIISITNNPI